jgi:hypothetical protein
LMEFKGTNLISVGIGPLSYDGEYVEVGAPDKSLSGDMLFTAESMNLVLPLMPVETVKEFQIFTQFMGRLPKPSDANFRECAKTYKQKANGVDVFPKLPAMVKAHYNRWQKNQAIKKANDAVGQSVVDLRRTLFCKSASIETTHAVDILKHVQNRNTDANSEPAMPMAGAKEEQEEEQPLHNFVPHIAAPAQKEYIAPHNITKDAGITTMRKCALFPYCKSIAMECGGTRRILCKNFNQFSNITEEQLQAAKTRVRSQEKRDKRQAADEN